MNKKALTLVGVATAIGSLACSNALGSTAYVYLSGSTAARSVVYATLKDTSGTAVWDSGTTVTEYDDGGSWTSGSSASGNNGASHMNFEGTLGGNPVIIKCEWSGSEAGYIDVSQSGANAGSETFLSDDGTELNDSEVVDICMADNAINFSRSSGYASSVTTTKVGVVPFRYVAEKGSATAAAGGAASFVNVTDEGIRQALRGLCPLYLFTGNTADTTSRVFISGRDNNSGTRVNCYGTTGFGIFTAPHQLEVNADGSMKDETGGGVYTGDYGYSGGGSVATQMGYDLSVATSIDIAPGAPAGSPHFSVVGYVGVSDAATAVSKGGWYMSYNGVPYSVGAVEAGQYNFWGNEYIGVNNSLNSGTVNTVYSKMTASSGVSAFGDNIALISLANMTAQRSGPTTDPAKLK
jgi:hypothetical protein